MPKPVLPDENELAQGSYEAYAEATGGKTFDGRDMPAWENLGEKIQGAWRAAAAKAISMRVDYGPQRWHAEPDSSA
jgi:hypothetical protein